MDMEADPVGVQKRTVSHFKGLFKTFKMRYSTFLYSYWISLHFMLTSFDEFFETGNFSLNSYSVHLLQDFGTCKESEMTTKTPRTVCS